MEELTLEVVGIRYPNADKSNRRFEVDLCRPGDAIELRREPRNKHDPRAVGVWRVGGGQMGYLSAERAGWIGQRLQSEIVRAIFQGFDGVTAYVRVRFGGEAPALPVHEVVRRTTLPPEIEDFYPDPDGPDFGA